RTMRTRIGHSASGITWNDGGVLPIAGSFLGWQPIAIAFALSLAASVAIISFLKQRHLSPYALVAFAAVLGCWLGWTWIGPTLAPLFFRWPYPVILVVGLIAWGLVAPSAMARRSSGAPRLR